MSLPAFDTLHYVKRLKEAGVNEIQAEAQAELQSEILSTLVIEKLSTKEDINIVRKDIELLKYMCGFSITLSLGIFGILIGVVMKIFTH